MAFIGRIEISQRSSLLSHRVVLSYPWAGTGAAAVKRREVIAQAFKTRSDQMITSFSQVFDGV
jgi:hypothetical protein